jgi:formate C-acetyltransferase
MINVIDSMVTIKKLIFDSGEMTAVEMLKRLDSGERVGKTGVAHHGADCDEANEMAARLSCDLCAVFETKTPYMGGKFLPSSIQFTTYINAGKDVGATPDGRLSGEPLCDSIGAINGNDVNGVTAMLNSAASLCQSKMAGTPVLNLKLDSGLLPLSLKGLVNGYFAQGGMQMQVTCVSREELLDAEQHPEKYPNLVVRIGGYSEYFSRLSPEHRRSVIERTCY